MGTMDPVTATLKNGKPVVVRVAMPEDADAYNALITQATSDINAVTELDEAAESCKARADKIRQALENPQELLLVADCDGTLLGELSFSAPALRRVAHRGRFGIYVASDVRGIGVGEALIRALLKWAAAHPLIEKVRLGVLSTNPGAIRLYHRLGFVEEARRTREFRLPGGRYADDILMSCYVKPLLPEP